MRRSCFKQLTIVQHNDIISIRLYFFNTDMRLSQSGPLCDFFGNNGNGRVVTIATVGVFLNRIAYQVLPTNNQTETFIDKRYN